MSKRSGLLEAALVAVRGSVQEQHDRVLRNGLTVVLGIARRIATLNRRWRLEAQHLLDGGGDQRPVVDDLPALVGMVGEKLRREPDQPGGRLVPGPGDHGRVPEHLGAGQATSLTVLLDLGVQQLRHQVVRRVVGAPIDVGGERLHAVFERARVELAGPSLRYAQPRVDVPADRLLALFRNPEQESDRAHRHEHAEIGDDVEVAGIDQGIEQPGAIASYHRLDRGHSLRCEHAREESPVQIVQRRIFEEDDAGRNLHVGPDDVEDRPAARAIGIPVEERRLDVVPAAERVEPELLVVVERCVVPKALPDGIRIVVDPGVVRVVVDHAAAQSSATGRLSAPRIGPEQCRSTRDCVIR